MSGIYWVLFFLFTALSMAMALTPTTFIALITGYFIGWKAIPGLVIGYLAACLIGYKIGKLIDGGRLLYTLSTDVKVKEWIDKLRFNQLNMVILCRLSPVLPFALMNFVLAALGYDLRRYLLGSFLGMLPRTLLFIWIGAQAHHIVEVVQGDEQFGIQEISVILLTLLTFLGFFLIFKRSSLKY